MNILFLSRLYLPHVGGVEKHIYEISKILSKKHKITVITEKHDPNLLDYEKTDLMEIYRIPVFSVGDSSKKWYIWKWLLYHFHLFNKSDIIHIHDVFFWFLPFWIPLFYKRVFMTFHGYEGSEPPTNIQVKWHQLAALFTKGNICIGDFHHKWYHLQPDFTSYGGVAKAHHTAGKRSKSAIFIGRLHQDNGILDYLKVIKIIKIPLDIYGDGPLLSEAQKYASLHKLPVRFFGFIPNADKKISQYSIAFVSRYLAILESLINQTPIFAHYNNSIKFDYLSLAPFSSFITIEKDPEKIARAVKSLKLISGQNQKLVQGYNWASHQTWPKMVQTYETLWQK